MKVGVWLDTKVAHVITINEDDSVATKSIKSKIDTGHPKGGSRSKTVYGPVLTVKEKSYVERRKHQSNKYFAKIEDQINDDSPLFIFGPAQVKNQFAKYIKENSQKNINIVAVNVADSMTNNQRIAAVKKALQYL